MNSNERFFFFVSIPLALFLVGVAIYLSVQHKEEQLSKLDVFVKQCGGDYKILVADDSFRISCDAGYITVSGETLKMFNSQKGNKHDI